MITKTTNLDSQYMDLFKEIEDKSQGKIKVENLEQFFGCIQEIADLDSKFLRLPLDEPMFEIDANSLELMGVASPSVASASSSNSEIVKFSNEEFADELIGEDEIPF